MGKTITGCYCEGVVCVSQSTLGSVDLTSVVFDGGGSVVLSGLLVSQTSLL